MNYEDIYIKKDVLSLKDIEWLRTEHETLRQAPQNVTQRTQTSTRSNKLFKILRDNPLHQKISAFFLDIFPFNKVEYSYFSINYYELQNSYGIHCDNLGEKRGFYQAVIPIICPPQPTYTIVFDQTASENVEWVAPCFNKPPDYKPHYNKPIFDANLFGGWKDEPLISEEEGLRYWGPRWQQTFHKAYRGFSIKCAYEWHVGDIFIFNSKFLHCASELEKLNIESKTGLLICLQRT